MSKLLTKRFRNQETLHTLYKVALENGQSYTNNAFAETLANARAGVHLHRFEAVVDNSTPAVFGNTAGLYKARVVPLIVNGATVGMIVRRTVIGSSCDAVIFTWTPESGEMGDAHLHYVMNTGDVISVSTLIPHTLMDSLTVDGVKQYYMEGIKLASLRDYSSQKPKTHGACRIPCKDYTRLDAFVSVIHRDNKHKFWNYLPRGVQTCNTYVPGAARKRTIRRLLLRAEYASKLLMQA